jgi:hypothetical protein
VRRVLLRQFVLERSVGPTVVTLSLLSGAVALLRLSQTPLRHFSFCTDSRSVTFPEVGPKIKNRRSHSMDLKEVQEHVSRRFTKSNGQPLLRGLLANP